MWLFGFLTSRCLGSQGWHHQRQREPGGSRIAFAHMTWGIRSESLNPTHIQGVSSGDVWEVLILMDFCRGKYMSQIVRSHFSRTLIVKGVGSSQLTGTVL